MGHIGKLSRGLKWYLNNRDADGVLLPVISTDADKMLNVNYYLDYVKGKDKDQVNLALHKMFLLQHAPGGKKSVLYKELKKKLDDGDFKVKETKSVEKETKSVEKK